VTGPFTVTSEPTGPFKWQTKPARIVPKPVGKPGLQPATAASGNLAPSPSDAHKVVLTIIAKDPNDMPISGAEVRIATYEGRSGRFFDGQLRTGPDGAIKLDNLIRGEKYTFWVRAAGYGDSMQTLTLAESGPQPALEPFVLPFARLSISGVVVDANDSPVPRAMVGVSGTILPHRTTPTDQQGRFALANVTEGTVELGAQLTAPGGDSWYGNSRCKGGDKDVRIVMNWRTDAGGVFRDVANRPRPLTGKPLPKLDALGLADPAAKAAGRRVLLCFWDMDQRPSRRCIQILQAKLAELDAGGSGAPRAGVTVLTVQTAEADTERLKQWLDENNITMPVGKLPGGEAGPKLQAAFGAHSLPWLILTDDRHVVRAEGFAVEELADKLQAASARTAAAASRPAGGQ